MGLETSALVMASIAGGAAIGEAGFQTKAAFEKEKALDLQAKELQLQTQQKTLANYDVMEKVIDAQTAHMTTTGAAFTSPSFNAIQRNTLNIGAKRAKNLTIEGELAEENIGIEKKNVRNKLYAQLFGDASKAATTAFSAYESLPVQAE